MLCFQSHLFIIVHISMVQCVSKSLLSVHTSGQRGGVDIFIWLTCSDPINAGFEGNPSKCSVSHNAMGQAWLSLMLCVHGSTNKMAREHWLHSKWECVHSLRSARHWNVSLGGPNMAKLVNDRPMCKMHSPWCLYERPKKRSHQQQQWISYFEFYRVHQRVLGNKEGYIVTHYNEGPFAIVLVLVCPLENAINK